MSETINIVTIVAKNYLAQARVLVDSFKKHNPNGRAFVLLVDRVDGYFEPEKEQFELIEIEELGCVIPDLYSFCFKYNILELSTALKPFLLNFLFNKYKINKLVYFDPDILIVEKLDVLSEILDNYNIILTPHITMPFNDNSKPSELDILRAGSFNLGFIALSNSETSISMLNWWGKRLYNQCLVDVSNGLFVDQKWIDLVPGLFPGTYILREPGYNVAYWNLHERKIKFKNDKIYCNGKPLYFFHFSGYNPDRSQEISKYQDRFTFKKIGETSNLFSLYKQLLDEKEFHTTKEWPYAFSSFDNGVLIPDFVRRIFLAKIGDIKFNFGNPFETKDTDSFFKWLTSVNDLGISPLLYEIHNFCADLRQTFKDIDGKDRIDYLFWIIKYGKTQFKLDEYYIKDVKLFLEKNNINTINTVESIDFNKNQKWDKARRFYLKMRRFKILQPVLERIRSYIIKKFKPARYVNNTYTLTDFPNIQDAACINIKNEPGNSFEFGVNVAGYINSEKGMGEAVRSDVYSLQAVNVPFVLNNFIDTGSKNVDMSFTNYSKVNPYAINLIHVNADQVPHFANAKGESYFKSHYNIGYWAWELFNVPSEWHHSFRYFDEIWVPSTFIQNSISRVSPIPVVTMPHSILKTNNFIPKYKKIYFGINENSFIFLFMFDFDSFMERKNPLGLIKAFKKAFNKNEDVTLVLKSTHSEHYPNDFQTLKDAAKNTNVLIIDAIYTREEIQSLLALSDCYVSLHRSEGFGLTIAEAMGMGKPVIATAYSGNMDFMTPGNSFPVNYNLVEIDKDYGPYKKGWFWAEPDCDHASRLMRYVYENKEESKSVGKEAKEYIEKNFSPDSIGNIYKERLWRINNLFNYKMNNETTIVMENCKEG